MVLFQGKILIMHENIVLYMYVQKREQSVEGPRQSAITESFRSMGLEMKEAVIIRFPLYIFTLFDL